MGDVHTTRMRCGLGRVREYGAIGSFAKGSNGGKRTLISAGDPSALPTLALAGERQQRCTFLYLVQEKTVLALPRVSLVMCGVAVKERV